MTPFRTQNVPPPMCSYKLIISDITTPTYTPHEKRTPIHVALSSEGDVLCILHHGGRIQLWKLGTRLPGGGTINRGPAYAPYKLCDTLLDVSENVIEPRQICIWGNPGTTDTPGSLESFRVACLSNHADADVVSVLDFVRGEVTEATRVIIPGQHGRLVYSNEGIFWQSRNGVIHTGV